MSASQSRNFPGPAQSSFPVSSLKRKRHPSEILSESPVSRQIANPDQVESAQSRCQYFSGNYIISCFPTADTVIPQHQWATFVWNSRRPELTQMNRVDIFLFHADSLKQILHFPNVTNPPDQAGLIRAQVNDTWWGENGTKWAGENISYPFYWVIIRSDTTLDGSEIPQSTFAAVQTTYADSVLASMSATAAAAASSSSLASASSAASASHHTQSSTSGSLQPNSGGSSFPHWAIAVIVVLGFFAIVASCMLAFLIIRRIRRRSQSSSSNRNSMGSASPMMADAGNAPQTPLLAPGATKQSSLGHHAPSVVSPDGASTISRTNSAEAGPFSGADAAIMADAFRKALRKPGFPDLPVEEDSPEQKEELLNRELASEGRDIRNVGSSRGVKVEEQ